MMNAKKTAYILLTMLLCVLLSALLHLPLLLRVMDPFAPGCPEGTLTPADVPCVVPGWMRVTVPLLGVIAGYWVGQSWWRIVYVEKRHWKDWLKRR